MATIKRRMPRRLVSIFLPALICFGISLPASAQIEEIVVTATKREENVQDVPVAVSVLSGETIENSYSTGFEGLQSMIPSVSFRKGNTTRNSTVVVRGIGTISFSTAAEPSVATVVDGVVLGRSGQAFGDMYDLERLEVLRGPQGTLFGKNASAGVVNITTKRPSDEFEGYLDLNDYFGRGEGTFLLRVRGESMTGAGIFPAPTAIAPQIEHMYHASVVGEVEGVSESYFAISPERKLKHPAVVTITEAAREGLFAE